MVSNTAEPMLCTPDENRQFHERGYLIVKGLYSPEEVRTIREFYEVMGEAEKPVVGSWKPDRSPETIDPLQRWPRVMHPHRWDAMNMSMMLHPKVRQVLKTLMNDEPVACQSMFYYKPPGARGQALHQDNYYLKVLPSTCYAAWTAIDATNPNNGGMYLVPGSHTMEIVCPKVADPSKSFTTHLVNAPKGMKAIPALMEPGDTLFFNGSVVHGSGPNRTKTKWRRAFITHHMPKSSKSISKAYFPIYDFDGNEIKYEHTLNGGPCGEVSISSYDPYGA